MFNTLNSLSTVAYYGINNWFTFPKTSNYTKVPPPLYELWRTSRWIKMRTSFSSELRLKQINPRKVYALEHGRNRIQFQKDKPLLKFNMLTIQYNLGIVLI